MKLILGAIIAIFVFTTSITSEKRFSVNPFQGFYKCEKIK